MYVYKKKNLGETPTELKQKNVSTNNSNDNTHQLNSNNFTEYVSYDFYCVWRANCHSFKTWLSCLFFHFSTFDDRVPWASKCVCSFTVDNFVDVLRGDINNLLLIELTHKYQWKKMTHLKLYILGPPISRPTANQKPTPFKKSTLLYICFCSEFYFIVSITYNETTTSNIKSYNNKRTKKIKTK